MNNIIGIHLLAHNFIFYLTLNYKSLFMQRFKIEIIQFYRTKKEVNNISTKNDKN